MPTFAFFKNGEKLNQVNGVFCKSTGGFRNVPPFSTNQRMALGIILDVIFIQLAGANQEQIESTIDMIEKGMKPLKKLSSEDEFESIIAGDKLVCVHFFATWCPCIENMRIAPVLAKMAFEMRDTVEFVKVSI